MVRGMTCVVACALVLTGCTGGGEEPADGAVASSAAPAADAARAVYDFDFEHPVCAAGVAHTGEGFETAIENGE